MMSDGDLVRLIEPSMRQSLSDFGFDHVVVRSGDDHDGDPALFIEVSLGTSDKLWTGAAVNAVDSKIWSLLRDNNEPRIPYVLLTFEAGNDPVQTEKRVRDMLQV